MDDALYPRAVDLVTGEAGKASISWLQRRLRIGYNHAARLVERMEAEGHVSAPDAVGRREVLKAAFRKCDPDAEARAARDAVAARAARRAGGHAHDPPEAYRGVEAIADDLVASVGLDGAREVEALARAGDAEVLEAKAHELLGFHELDEQGVVHLVQIVERAEALIAERDAIAQTLRDLFAFAKAIGLEPRAIRGRIKERALAPELRKMREATDETYRAALGIEGPDFVVPLPRPAVDGPPKSKKITAREKQMRAALALIAADRATPLN